MWVLGLWGSVALAGPLEECRQGSAQQCEKLADGLAEAEPPELELAAELRSLACRRGHVRSCSELARQLREGRGVPVDWARALALDRKACRLGYSYGCAAAASSLRQRHDLREARRLAARSCAQGSGWGCNLEGIMLELGEGAFDPARAAARYQAACDDPFPAGCHNLSRLLSAGYGVPSDVWRARALLREACEDEYAPACLEEARWLTESAQRHPQDAVGFLEQACALGQDAGCVDLAWALLHGRGTSPDPQRAREVLDAACTHGYGQACTDLAQVLTEGLGVEPDLAAADERLWTACTAQVPSACRASSERALADGRFERAAQALHQACELGDNYACELVSPGDPLQTACRAGAAQACLSWADVLGDSSLARQVRAAACGTEHSCEPAPPVASVAHAPALEPWRGCFERGLNELGSLELQGRGGPRDEASTAAVRALFARAGLELRDLPLQATLRRRWSQEPLRVGRAEIPHAPYVYSGSGAVVGRTVRVDPQELLDPRIRPDLEGKVALLPSDDDLYHHAWLAWNAGAEAVIAPAARMPRWDEGEAPLPAGTIFPQLPVPLLGVPAGLLPRDGLRVQLSVHLTDVPQPYVNLLATLPGRGPLADEIVVVGAHYDHLGVDRWGRVYPGADDNASGVAALACAAESLQRELADEPSARTVVVALFDAEELGGMGSAALLDSGELDISSVNAMVNLDMVGRLHDRPLGLRGLGHAGLAAQAAQASAQAELPVGRDPDGRGASDDLTFRLAGVPALSLHTGIHHEYHTPLDEIALIDL
jgi:TPR repeat protein